MLPASHHPKKHAVIMTIYQEPALQILRAVASVRRHEPSYPVVVVSDGISRPDVALKADRLGFRFVAGDHLKSLPKAASWWTRFFGEGLAEGTDYLLKLDPDAFFWRPFRTVPPGDYYGTVQSLGNVVSIQGGCQGFSRKAALHIMESGFCDDHLMANPHVWYPDRAAAEWMRSTDYLSTDWTIGHIAACLDILPVDWSEVRSVWREPVSNPDLKYAVTHPYKEPISIIEALQ